MSKDLVTWKWAVREIGGLGMWTGKDSESEAKSALAEWIADGFEAEVVALYDQSAIEDALRTHE